MKISWAWHLKIKIQTLGFDFFDSYFVKKKAKLKKMPLPSFMQTVD
jgi:hypothetical protein